MGPRSLALVELGRALRAAEYSFVTPTPETHRRNEARSAGVVAHDLRDVFGWSRPFRPALVPEPMLGWMHTARVLGRERDGLLRSRVRFSTLGSQLFAHSAYPTCQVAAVFFGPDTYRFCALLRRWVPEGRRLVDVGCGCGAGGIVLASAARRCVLSDVNAGALVLARVNAVLNGVDAELAVGDVLSGVDGDIDLVVANPPYMRDPAGRLYRDGGGDHGEALALRIVRESLGRLRRGGLLILYTGAAIVDGVDTFRRAAEPLLHAYGARVEYEELDPDVFGEELERPGYEDVERIAVVGLRAALA